MKTVKLHELLSEAALAELKVLYDQRKLNARDIKAMLVKYESELAAKGVDAGYLAYVIEYLADPLNHRPPWGDHQTETDNSETN